MSNLDQDQLESKMRRQWGKENPKAKSELDAMQAQLEQSDTFAGIKEGESPEEYQARMKAAGIIVEKPPKKARKLNSADWAKSFK